MSHKSKHPRAISVTPAPFRPYNESMAQQHTRETMPPGADDEAAAAFERACAEQGEYWARARNVAERLRAGGES